MEITEDEADALQGLRDTAPCVIMNDEAASILESLTDDCNCPACRFFRIYLEQIALEESRGEQSH